MTAIITERRLTTKDHLAVHVLNESTYIDMAAEDFQAAVDACVADARSRPRTLIEVFVHHFAQTLTHKGVAARFGLSEPVAGVYAADAIDFEARRLHLLATALSAAGLLSGIRFYQDTAEFMWNMGTVPGRRLYGKTVKAIVVSAGLWRSDVSIIDSDAQRIGKPARVHRDTHLPETVSTTIDKPGTSCSWSWGVGNVARNLYPGDAIRQMWVGCFIQRVNQTRALNAAGPTRPGWVLMPQQSGWENRWAGWHWLNVQGAAHELRTGPGDAHLFNERGYNEQRLNPASPWHDPVKGVNDYPGMPGVADAELQFARSVSPHLKHAAPSRLRLPMVGLDAEAVTTGDLTTTLDEFRASVRPATAQ